MSEISKNKEYIYFYFNMKIKSDQKKGVSNYDLSPTEKKEIALDDIDFNIVNIMKFIISFYLYLINKLI